MPLGCLPYGGRKSFCILHIGENAYARSNLQTFKPSNLQTFKPSNLQTFKPYKALIALFAALSLCLFAACSDGSDDGEDTGDPIPTEAQGEYNATSYLASQINTALTKAGISGITLTADAISLTINSGNTVSVSVSLSTSLGIPFSGTCKYTSSTSSFTFTLDFETELATIGNAILSQFNPATYKDGAHGQAARRRLLLRLSACARGELAARALVTAGCRL